MRTEMNQGHKGWGGHKGQLVCAALVLASAALGAQQDGQWLMYSGSYSSHRFSPLKQITTDNVAKLRPAWVYQPPGTGSIESTPVVANGVMYVTSGPTMVAALDLRSGKSLWEWTRPIAPSVLNLGFPRVNRGVAVLDNMVYVGTLDGYLFALDARAGIERWSVHVGENPTGHSITAAPLVVDDKVIVGISGGEAGIRGFLDAYDAKTGKQLWRFYTIPSPGEPGQRGMAGRQLGSRRRRDLADRFVRSRAQAALLGHRQSGSRLERRLSQRRQPLHVVAGGDRRRHRQAALAFPVHAARRARLGREPDSGAGRYAGRRPRSARWSSPRTATASFTRSIAKPESSYSARRTRSRRGRRGWTSTAGRWKYPAWSRPKKARWSIRACRDRRTGRARRTARRQTCSTCRCARWDRSITRPASSTNQAPTTPAAARSGSTRNRGARSARSTSRPASRRGTSCCRRRRGPE